MQSITNATFNWRNGQGAVANRLKYLTLDDELLKAMMKMSNPIVSVIITCLNGKFWIDRLIPPLLDSSLENFEVIFVDNGSTDGSLEYLAANYFDPRIITKRLDINRGYTGGNNYAAQFANADLLFFLSVDVQVSRDTISTLVSFYKPHHGVLGPKVFNLSGDGAPLDNGETTCVIDFFGYPISEPKRIRFYVEGCAFLIQKNKFVGTGGFDELLVTYAEDVDLSWRMWLLGYENVVASDTSVVHCGGSSSVHYSSPKSTTMTTYYRRYHSAKNIIRNALKNYALHNVIWIVPTQIFLLTLESIYYLLIQRNLRASKNIISAIAWNFKNIKSTLVLRKKTQKMRICSDSTIKKRMIGYPLVLTFFMRHGSPKYLK